MLKKTGILIVLLLLALLIGGQLLTNEFRVEESLVVQASPQQIHPYVNNLKQWPKWAPWQINTPGLKVSYGNISQGVGATQRWQDKRGNGHLKITASSIKNGIAYDIYFGKNSTPSISAIEYLTKPDQTTQVTWRFHGDIDIPLLGGYIARLIELKVSANFKRGLHNLKKLVEQG